MWKKRIPLLSSLAVMATAALVGTTTPAQADAAALPMGVALPGCAVTFIPDAGNPTAGVRCLERETGAESAAASSAAAVPFVTLWQNGPYPPSSGWGITYEELGLHNLPSNRNDDASSWDSGPNSCGEFSVNAAGTQPFVNFAPNGHGNFPFGSVPNDSVSGLDLTNFGC
jgi:hypothetical protein